MENKNFETWFKKAMKWEGGIADRPKQADPVGLTNKGITYKYFVLGNWGKHINKPSNSETFYNLTDSEVGKIAKAEFWNRFKIDKIVPSLQILAMDTVWGSGSLKSLGAKNYIELNKLAENHNLEYFKEKRKAYLEGLKNAKYNAGWFNRLEDIYVASLEALKKKDSELS